MQPSNGGHYHSHFLPNPVKSLCKILYVTGLYNPLLCSLSPLPLLPLWYSPDKRSEQTEFLCLYGTDQSSKMAAPTETHSMGVAILPPEQSRPGCRVGKTPLYGTVHAGEPRTGSGRIHRYGCDSRLGLSRDGRFWNCRSEGGHVW